MDDLILWFDRLFREPLAGTTINLLNVIQFLLIFILFLIATRFLRRLLRPFIARLEIDEHAQERILWLVFLIVLAFGLVFGLTVLGIDLTLLERVLNYSIPVGQTELSLTKLLWFLAVVIGAVPPI